MIIEAEKIKRLTEKLREQGDISEDEADYIYMLRRIFALYNATYYAIFLPDPAAKTTIKRCFTDMGKEYMESTAGAFEDWYKAVCELVNNKKSGNFISTVVVKSNRLNVYDFGLGEKRRKTHGYIRTIIENISEKDKITEFQESEIVSGNLLSLDVVNHKASRYGLAGRIENKFSNLTKDVFYLHDMSEKLQKTEDISFDESTLIYTIFKFAQSLFIVKKFYPIFGGEGQLKALDNALHKWFRSVWQCVKQGKENGNFLYTVPLDGYFMFKAKTYIKNIFKGLQKNESFAVMGREAVRGISLDISKKDNGIFLHRHGSIRPEISLDDLYTFPCSDMVGVACSWMYFKKGEESECSCLISPFSKKCYGMVGKLEYLAEKGIFPVMVTMNSSEKGNIVFHKEDRDIAAQVMSIPDKIIEDNTPAVKDQNDEDAVRRSIETSKIFVDLFVQSKVERVKDQNDEWLVIDR